MILRLWNGWTTRAQADAYDRVLNGDVAPAIAARELEGLTRFEVWRRTPAATTGTQQFLTTMWFDDMDAVARFTGSGPAQSVVPPQARAVLQDFDQHAQHFELRQRHV